MQRGSIKEALFYYLGPRSLISQAPDGAFSHISHTPRHNEIVFLRGPKGPVPSRDAHWCQGCHAFFSKGSVQQSEVPASPQLLLKPNFLLPHPKGEGTPKQSPLPTEGSPDPLHPQLSPAPGRSALSQEKNKGIFPFGWVVCVCLLNSAWAERFYHVV